MGADLQGLELDHVVLLRHIPARPKFSDSENLPKYGSVAKAPQK